MLRHMEGLGQIYDKTQFTQKIVRESFNTSYDKVTTKFTTAY